MSQLLFRLFFVVSWLSSIFVIGLPILYFLMFGWSTRKQEFVNRLRDHDLTIYFQKFSSLDRHQPGFRRTHAPARGKHVHSIDADEQISAFERRYDRLIG